MRTCSSPDGPLLARYSRNDYFEVRARLRSDAARTDKSGKYGGDRHMTAMVDTGDTDDACKRSTEELSLLR